MTAQHPSLTHVNKSGFPLQIALARLVRSMQSNWRIMYEEHAWRSDEGSGFVDIVLECSALSSVLLIECKRLQNASYIFLPSGRDDRTTGRAKAYVAKRGADRQLLRGYPAWIDLELVTNAPEVAYCVVRKGGGEAREKTIEPIGAELIAATEAIEHEERDFYLDQEGGGPRGYFSAIVTTAQLELCTFDSTKIALSDGLIPADAKIEPVDVVRFRKQLSFRTPSPSSLVTVQFDQSARLASAKERTVFVMSAEYFETFLRKFQPR